MVDRGRILVVGSSESMRRDMTELLRAEGHEVETAADVAEAMKGLGGGKVDLVVCETWMPLKNGWDLLEEVGELEPKVGVVLVGTRHDPADGARAVRRGACTLLRRPVPDQAMVLAVSNSLMVVQISRMFKQMEPSVAWCQTLGRVMDPDIQGDEQGFPRSAVRALGFRGMAVYRGGGQEWELSAQWGLADAELEALQRTITGTRSPAPGTLRVVSPSSDRDPALRPLGCLLMFGLHAGEGGLSGTVIATGRDEPPDEKELESLWALVRDYSTSRADTARLAPPIGGSYRDELTGLLARDYLEYRLAKMITEATVKPVPRSEDERPEGIAVLELDLDGFQAVNEEHGHPTGGRLLREAGAVIHRRVREGDLVARHEADSFTLILPGLDGKQALGIAERIRRRIEGHTFLRREKIRSSLTCTIGVAAFPADAGHADALFEAARGALSKGKKAGGNRVVGATAEQASP